MELTFIFKKIVSIFLMPLPLGLFFIVIALLFLYKNKVKAAKTMLLLSLTWFFLFSYPPLVNVLVHKLESKYATLHTAPKEVKYIYILGSGHTTDESLPITSQVSRTAIVRLNEGIHLYHQLNENASLILSGYTGLYDPTAHAVMQEKLALALGIKKEHIILRPKPKDTQEEAKAAKELIGNETFILVTSATHMKRSMIYFKHEGLTPIPAPTNHLASLKHLNYTNVFSAHALEMSTVAFHEILGLIWQKVKGI